MTESMELADADYGAGGFAGPRCGRTALNVRMAHTLGCSARQYTHRAHVLRPWPRPCGSRLSPGKAASVFVHPGRTLTNPPRAHTHTCVPEICGKRGFSTHTCTCRVALSTCRSPPHASPVQLHVPSSRTFLTFLARPGAREVVMALTHQLPRHSCALLLAAVHACCLLPLSPWRRGATLPSHANDTSVGEQRHTVR